MFFMQQHGGIGAVEQQAVYLAAVAGLGCRQLAGVARQAQHLGPHEGLHGLTHGHRTAATGGEQQALVRAQLDRVAANGGGAPVEPIVRADETGDERRVRLVVKLLRRADLLEAPGVHHRDMIRQHKRLGLVVRDVHERGAKGGLQLLQLDLHVLAQLQVERAERLVQQQERRLQHQAARNGHALLLPAGELVDTLRLRPGQAHAFEHLRDPPCDLVARHAAPRQAVTHVVAHRHHREQRQVLEHHVHRAAVRGHAVHRPATDADVAAVRRNEAGDHAQQRRLAAAGGAEDREEAAALDAERKFVDGGVAAEALDDALGLQVGRCRHCAQISSPP